MRKYCLNYCLKVMEIFQTVRDSAREPLVATKSQSSSSTLTSLCPDISPTNSQFFEVLYVGRMKVSHRKAPDTFIDDALEKFKLYELEKSRKHLVSQSSESFDDENVVRNGTGPRRNCDNSKNNLGSENSVVGDLQAESKPTESGSTSGTTQKSNNFDVQHPGNMNTKKCFHSDISTLFCTFLRVVFFQIGQHPMN